MNPLGEHLISTITQYVYLKVEWYFQNVECSSTPTVSVLSDLVVKSQTNQSLVSPQHWSFCFAVKPTQVSERLTWQSAAVEIILSSECWCSANKWTRFLPLWYKQPPHKKDRSESLKNKKTRTKERFLNRKWTATLDSLDKLQTLTKLKLHQIWPKLLAME